MFQFLENGFNLYLKLSEHDNEQLIKDFTKIMRNIGKTGKNCLIYDKGLVLYAL
jgi:hypothetical protein